MGLEIIQHVPPRDQELTALRSGLREFNLTQLPHLSETVQEFGFFLRNETKIWGGISGRTFLAALQIQYFWVHEEVRGKGYGRKLLLAAEEFGESYSCRFSIADTLSFQSLEFYQKNGYLIEFMQQGYAEDVTAYHLRKRLSPAKP